MKVPSFWRCKGIVSTLLLPAAALYRLAARARHAVTVPHSVPVPVICIGNLVAGGSGKTPVALALGELMAAQGAKPHFLSRGYKGILKGPVLVDPLRHTANEVGDEPLLLAQLLPTWVSKDRLAGARAAVKAGAGTIIMDDGYQNPCLAKDINLLVVGGEYGFGNGRLLPAGPLREPPADGFARASAVMLIGQDRTGVLNAKPAHLPVLTARIEPQAQRAQWQGKAVIAFAGIARPEQFFATLESLGADIRARFAYADHHVFRPADLDELEKAASLHRAALVTTTKDYARLAPSWRAHVQVLPVRAVFDNNTTLIQLVLGAPPLAG